MDVERSQLNFGGICQIDHQEGLKGLVIETSKQIIWLGRQWTYPVLQIEVKENITNERTSEDGAKDFGKQWTRR